MNRGLDTSVGRSNYRENIKDIAFSPIVENHSLRGTERKFWLENIDQDNKKLLDMFDRGVLTAKNE